MNIRCWPLRRWVGVLLIALGAILFAVFIPVRFWGVAAGIILVVAGIFCL